MDKKDRKKERKKERKYLWILYKLWIKIFLEINKLIFFSQKMYFEISSQIKEINEDKLMKFLSKYKWRIIWLPLCPVLSKLQINKQ